MSNEKSAAELIAQLGTSTHAGPSTSSSSSSRVVTVTGVSQFEELLKDAPGPVLVDFTQKDCPACEGEGEKLERLAKCENVTVLSVEDTPETSALFDRYNVEGTPTLLYAEVAAKMTPDAAKEVEPDDKKLLRKLKCAVEK